MRRAVMAGLATLAVAGVLAACSSGGDAVKDAGENLPDLSARGFVSFACGDGDAIGGSFQDPAGTDYRAECWSGSPQEAFPAVADAVLADIIESTGAVDATGVVCKEDSLSVAGGIACRAAYLEDGGDGVVIRTVVILAEPAAVLGALPEDPTQEQVFDALSGAAVEILVGTEPPVHE